MQHLQHRQDNPGAGLAAVGAGVGGLLAGLGALALALAGRNLLKGEQAELTEQAHPVGDRLMHLGVGAATSLGAAFGASLGAAPHQKGRAFAGALYGTAPVVLGLVAVNPDIYVWDVSAAPLAAATGAGIGAATAR
jgi:hypothetical protein